METCETLSSSSKTYQFTWLKIYHRKTLRSQNCRIWSSSILNKMTSKFANYFTLGYSRISLRHHWITIWVCRVIYKSRTIERTSNHILTTPSCWAITRPPPNRFGGGVWVKKKPPLKKVKNLKVEFPNRNEKYENITWLDHNRSPRVFIERTWEEVRSKAQAP